MTKKMDRRSFLKFSTAAGVAATTNLSAVPLVGDSILDSTSNTISASHWGAFNAEVRNGRFEGVNFFKGDEFPTSMIRALPARTYAKNRVLYPCVREGYLKNGYQSDKSKRGSEKFVRVSWEKAFDLIADELKRVYKDYGPDAIFGGSYGWFCVGSLNNPQALLGRMLGIAGGYTSRALTYSTHCIRAITPYVTGADESSNQQTSYPNLIANTECVVFWSADPLVTNQIAWGTPDHKSYTYMKELREEGKKRGIKFYCIDPVYNDTAVFFGAEQIKVRPTTDVALMLGIAHYLYAENLYDEKFVKRYTTGFEEFRKYLVGEGEDKVVKTPEWAAKICGVDAAIIKTLAKTFVSKRTMLMGGWGFQRAHHGEQPHWMLTTLAAMIGQIGLPGGGYGFAYHYSDGGVPAPAAATGNPLSVDINGGMGLAAGAEVAAASPGLSGISVNTRIDGPWKGRKTPLIPVSRIVECLENPGKDILFDGRTVTYPDLKLAYWAGGNPFHHHQDRNRMIKAWRKFETFIVNECFWTATAKMADIVLPATTEQERNDITRSHTNSYIFAMKKVVEPAGEAMNDYEIFQNIIKRFGKDEENAFTEGRTGMEWIKYFYQESYEKGTKSGINIPTFDEFWAKGYVEFEAPESAKNFIKLKSFRDNPITNRLGTPSGKIEIFSRKIAGYNYKECKGHPAWFEPMEWLGSKETKQYPLNLVTPHPKYRLHSQLNNTWMRKFEEVQEREPIWINPKDAAKRGIKNGDVVRIFNKRGQILGGVVVTDYVMEGVVRMQEGSWYDPQDPTKANTLCVHGDVNVLIADIGSSELAQGNQATALVEIEKFKGELPRINVFEAPIVKES
ncbi:MAG: trimethylamine-N-oxide reductase TorA [Campylobacteraceae bacterium]